MSWFRHPYTGAYNAVYEWQGANVSECGPAALATLIRQHRGYNAVTRFTCRAKQPEPSWWTAHSIVSASTALGLHTELTNYTLSRQAGIYLSTYWGFGHWVVAWLHPDGRVQVLDPKRGQYRLTEREFRRRLKSNIYVASSVVF